MAIVTIKDIAKACDVSFSTVSKALKGSSEIGESTIKLVEETAKKMGYQPNIAARTLRTNRSFDIGILFEDRTGVGLQHQYFAEVFSSINIAANMLGYNITFLSVESKNKGSYLQQALYRRCDGVVVVSVPDFLRDDIQKLLKSSVPVITLDFVSDFKESVLSDNYEGMRSLVEYAIQKGHKRIAYIMGEDSLVTETRLKAYKDVLVENKIDFNQDYVIQAKYHESDSSEKATSVLMELENPPTCILYPDDFACIGGMRYFNRFGKKIGKDISVIGYDGILISSLISPALTTYSQNAKEIGIKLIEKLVSQIDDKQISKKKNLSKNTVTYVSGHFVEGESVANLK